MIQSEKFQKIARGLLEKTKQDKLNWLTEPDTNCFVLKLPNSKIELRYESPKTEFDQIILLFRNSKGFPVGRWTVEEETAEWPLASELYEEVNRNTTGWDKVLEDVEAFLASDSKKTG